MNFEVKNILVPTDFSPTGSLAIDHAVFMARLFKAHLFLLHAIEISETTYRIYNPAVPVPVPKEIEIIVRKMLEEQAEMLRKHYSVKVTTICTHGKTASEIQEAVKENKVDLVVMGTHGASGFNEYFAGSNADKVVTVCPCPVITVQTQVKKLGFANILLPVDNSTHSRQKVNAAITLAKKYASKIHILGLFRPEDATDEKKFGVKIESVEKLVKKAGLSCSTKILKEDNLALAALKYAKKIKADLLVVMTGHESNLSGMYLGPFAKQIVNHSRVPVMSIKTEPGNYDFISLAAATPF
jgi:nucleotide-binding universal stress UspA family protein